ncbi:hypothetical protein N431DRAFT_524157 [Stipitochalara longipes BDJ]|nr:hypothetical protein N431DRAFT_524157 [Stipitochalara longipes BDJ]
MEHPHNHTGKGKTRKRASKPKVRSGCSTCKTRKVKCDESKPSCLRCQKLDLTCIYPGPKPKKPEPQKQIRKLLLPSTLIEPSEALFGNQDEWKYFQLFRSEAAAELAGFFEQPFWDRLILQACHSEVFVREAVVAISASRIARSAKAGQMGVSMNPIVTRHREAALLHYGKAIRKIKEDLSKPNESGTGSPRRVLIACLLVCCLEGMWGNSFNALAHAKSGLSLLRTWVEKNPHVKKDRIGTQSPSPDVVEDEIVHAFARLDIQMLTFIDVRSAEEHALMIDEGKETIEKMPTRFSFLEEARVYFELISRRAMHFMQVAVRALADAQKAGLETTSAYYYQATQKKYAEELERWSQAFHPLYERIQRKKVARVDIAAHLLFVNSMAMNIILATCLHTDNMCFDDHLEKFRAIVEVSKVIVDAKQSRRFSFSFDSGVTPWLSAVCKWCRDRKLRREAIRLLRAVASQEGVWDSLMIAEIGECMMKLEEESVETEDIPEEARVRLKHVNMNVAEKMLTVECVRGHEEEESIKRVVEVNWPFGEWI